jgi:hypothetical protein
MTIHNRWMNFFNDVDRITHWQEATTDSRVGHVPGKWVSDVDMDKRVAVRLETLEKDISDMVDWNEYAHVFNRLISLNCECARVHASLLYRLCLVDAPFMMRLGSKCR